MLARVHGRVLAPQGGSVKTICTNPHVEAVRAAYKKSPNHRRLHGEVEPPQNVRELVRVPGQDDEELPLGIGRDPLEEEFMGGQK